MFSLLTKSLRNKFLIPTLVAVTIGMSIATYVSFYQVQTALDHSTRQEIELINSSTSSVISAWVQDRKLDVTNWSSNKLYATATEESFVGKAARKTASQQLANLKKQYGHYDQLDLVDNSGMLIASSSGKGIGDVSFAEHAYFKPALTGKVVVSQVHKDKTTGNAVFVIASPVPKKAKAKGGVLVGVVNLENFSSHFIYNVKLGETGYAYMLNKDGVAIAHPDSSQVLTLDLSNQEHGRQMLSAGSGLMTYDSAGVEKLVGFQEIGDLGWILAVEADMQELSAPARAIASSSIWLTVIIVLILGLILFFVARTVVRPINYAVEVADKLAAGDLAVEVDIISQDETGTLLTSIKNMVTAQRTKAGLAGAIAQGDLTLEATLASDKDTLGRALMEMGNNLNEIITEVNTAAEEIASGSDQVSDSSQTLSQGATEQASALEQITSSTTQISSQTKVNADNAQQAQQLANKARDVAQVGNQQMEGMLVAMEEINVAGKDISKIIKVIDEIAFQTNLLALNAAVEAARAGQHGKGFAVVAEEVRNLAARSAKAAEETTILIEGTVQKTDSGSEIAAQAAASLSDIVESIAKVSGLVEEIAQASSEQSEGLTQVGSALGQIENVTQQNTANAEESAAAAEELSAQGAQMKALMTRFKTRGRVPSTTDNQSLLM